MSRSTTIGPDPYVMKGMEEELKESLRALAWARYAPLLEHYAAIRAMSDDEYLATLPPPEDAETRAERLMQRNRWTLDESQLRSVADAEVERLLPLLRKAREATGKTGPVDPLEYHQAAMANTTNDIRQTAAMMRARAMSADPRRAEILSALAEVADVDAADFQTLGGDPTEARLQGVTDRVLGRMHSLHQGLFGINPN